MKKLRGLLIVGVAMLMSINFTQAQSYSSLGAMFSQTSPGGTARMQALGGAQISLGGDVSSTYSNPAGLGMFNRNSFSLSTGLSFINNGSSYYGTHTSDLKLNVNIPNFGIVLQKDGNNKIKSHAFGLSYNRVADYQNRIVYEGRNTNTSMIDAFIENANGENTDQFYGGGRLVNSITQLAYDNYLIGDSTIVDANAPNNYYFTDVLSIPQQRETINQKGSQYQLNLAYGMNYNDILFVGANIGIVNLNYNIIYKYSENFTNDYLNKFNIDEELTIDGNGVNTSLGILFRPTDYVQLGATFKSPTYYMIKDTYNAEMSSSWNNFEYLPSNYLDNEYSETDIIISNYTLTSPLKLSGGATFFAGKYGFVTADIEMIDYSNNRLRSDDFSTQKDNDEIQRNFGKVNNFRLGAEARISNFMIRGGYSYSENGAGEDAQSFTGGAGARFKHVSFDLAVINSLRGYKYYPYNYSNPDVTPVVNVFRNATKVITSVGFYF